MSFEVGDDIVNRNNEFYIVEKVEVIRLPPDTPGGQGDIARYHYDIKKYNTGEKKRIFFIVEEDPDNNVDTNGVTWNKIIARGKNKTRRRQTKRKRRQSKRKRHIQSKRRRRN